MSNKTEQLSRSSSAECKIAEPKSTPEVILIKDHPHLILGPHHPISQPVPQSLPQQLQQSEPNLDTPELIAEEKNSVPAEHLSALGLYKSYRKGSVEVPVLTNLDMEIRRGEFVSIVGQSGSGKSTLLHLLGTLDVPDQGEIHFDGQRIDNLPTPQRDALRNKRIGMIFQFYHLLPELTTLENVLSPLMIADSTWQYLKNRKKHKATAMGLLETVGLSHRLKHKPRELSGGEMQRAAIARALVAQPELLLADEPTGNLDQASGQEILKILRTLNQQHQLTIVMVTHDQSLALLADRIVRLTRGRIENKDKV
jgi:lipoprotein-releasing system ATP-binding protein